jgi:hypothetical protein
MSGVNGSLMVAVVKAPSVLVVEVPDPKLKPAEQQHRKQCRYPFDTSNT